MQLKFKMSFIVQKQKGYTLSKRMRLKFYFTKGRCQDNLGGNENIISDDP